MRASSWIALGLIFLAGCASSGGRISEGDKAIESYAKLKADLQKGQEQIGRTMTAMDELANVPNSGADFSKAYKNFTKEVDNVQKAGDRAKQREAVMRDNTEKYIDRWQQEMETISDPTIKANLAQRREAVRVNFEQVRNAASAAREAYDPFVRDLLEIEKALSIDTSPNVLPGLRPAFDKAHQDAGTLDQRIAALQAQLDRISAGLGASVSGKSGG